MSKSRLDLKVGFFVLFGLAVLAGLLVEFGKGTSWRPTWTLTLKSVNVGGLALNAKVLMAGVAIGKVSEIELSPDSKSVRITLRIYKQYKVYRDAKFAIEQAGFLGDQYVAVLADRNEGGTFADGGEALAMEPFNFQEVARTASGLIRRIDDTASNLNSGISDVRRLVLNEQTLTNLSRTAEKLRESSDHALKTLDDIDALFATNGQTITYSTSNLLIFSRSLNRFADSLNEVVASNRESVSASVKNLQSSTETLKGMLADVNAGKGPVGALLRNDQISTNFAEIVNNLSVTTSNLNRLGLWSVLWSHPPPKTNHSAAEPAHPKRVQPD